MLFWEAEYKKTRRLLKILLIILGILLALFAGYYFFFSKNYFSKISDEETGKMLYNKKDADKIIVEFDNGFLDTKKYQILIERSYKSLPLPSQGRQNPFEPYETIEQPITINSGEQQY